MSGSSLRSLKQSLVLLDVLDILNKATSSTFKLFDNETFRPSPKIETRSVQIKFELYQNLIESILKVGG